MKGKGSQDGGWDWEVCWVKVARGMDAMPAVGNQQQYLGRGVIESYLRF